MIGFSFDGKATLLAPIVRLAGDMTEIAGIPSGDGYACGVLFVRDEVKALGDGKYRVARHIRNTADTPVSFQDIRAVRDSFASDKYLIPCILYNGNEHGA